ncbi:MAG: Cytochrome c biogenesis protein TlpA [Candidatus Accumulibacter appositus]|uniref:Cytochrome c biogenesis protein TlpA n=1 Tax=Candidatus Accumulibacter appositus TaxID=1454003 RepID=A0A011NE77_9PROT|nr:TlpA disulfide reductase family protein [Accumulibacter sp.]EXI80948.1 MAG: Cytochrome c biogenesis protein TlpA [Candidatus Accumulibacter appositus]HRF03796.1 TlpA disulfide reductase family protein [Accumulibacter sp.]
MNQQRALWVAVVAGVLTVATVALLAYRVLVLGGLPPGDTIPDSLRSPPQVSPAEAQAEVDALMSLTLDDLDGAPQAMAQWRGKILVVNYWASWCKPCVEEMPAFSRLHGRYAAQGVQFVGIGIDEVDNMRAFVKTTAVSYPLLVGGRNASETPGLQVKALPYTVVIRRDGRFESSRLGRLDEVTLEALLNRLIGH